MPEKYPNTGLLCFGVVFLTEVDRRWRGFFFLLGVGVERSTVRNSLDVVDSIESRDSGLMSWAPGFDDVGDSIKAASKLKISSSSPSTKTFTCRRLLAASVSASFSLFIRETSSIAAATTTIPPTRAVVTTTGCSTPEPPSLVVCTSLTTPTLSPASSLRVTAVTSYSSSCSNSLARIARASTYPLISCMIVLTASSTSSSLGEGSCRKVTAILRLSEVPSISPWSGEVKPCWELIVVSTSLTVSCLNWSDKIGCSHSFRTLAHVSKDSGRRFPSVVKRSKLNADNSFGSLSRENVSKKSSNSSASMIRVSSLRSFIWYLDPLPTRARDLSTASSSKLVHR